MVGNDQQFVLYGNNGALVPYTSNPPFVPYGGSQTLIRYNGNQQPVIHGAYQTADPYSGGQQAMYNNVQNISAALGGTRRPFQYIHNEGSAHISDTYKPDCNTIFYNAPNSTVSFSGPGSRFDSGFGPGSGLGMRDQHDVVYYRCRDCKSEFDSAEGLSRHQKDYTRVCEQHQVCHDSWTAHIERFSHTKCPISSCRREFTREAQFVRHFRLSH